MEEVNERANIPRPALLLVTRIVQFNHRILNDPAHPQAAKSVLRCNPKLKRPRPAGRKSYKNLLYNITSAKGSTPLTKLTPDSRSSQHVEHLLSNLKRKSFVAARIKAIPLNMHTLEQLPQLEGQLPQQKKWLSISRSATSRSTKRSRNTADQAPVTAESDLEPDADLSTRMEIAGLSLILKFYIQYLKALFSLFFRLFILHEYYTI